MIWSSKIRMAQDRMTSMHARRAIRRGVQLNALTLATAIGKQLLVLALLLLLPSRSAPARAQDVGIDLERIERATVFIMQATTTGSDVTITCVGSGTLVSRDGLILTNAHNTVSGQNCPGDTLIIALKRAA